MAVNQISVFLENRTGQLAEITKLLSENGINLRAISIAETADYGVLRIIADDTEKASSVLLENGSIISKTPVTVVAVPDKPAGLSNLLAIIATGNVDIEYMYSIFTHQNGNAFMVFRIENVDKFVNLIESNGMSVVSESELGIK